MENGCMCEISSTFTANCKKATIFHFGVFFPRSLHAELWLNVLKHTELYQFFITINQTVLQKSLKEIHFANMV